MNTESGEKIEIYGTENNVLHTQELRIMTESENEIQSGSKKSVEIDGAEIRSTSNKDGLKISAAPTGNSKTENTIKTTKRKRRRKPKTNGKPYKKSNWKFQIPRYRNRQNNNERDKLIRSRSIVPYNTNRFLMEEHMAEVPISALLTPCGRTRDSSFSVDSEDNYFHSLPEDEEEFLSKEFANVYERARVERLESMSKQQLIEECLQIEDRYTQTSEHQMQQNCNYTDFINKIKFLEDKIRELNAENCDLRRKLEYAQNKTASHADRMCSSSEDSESDSTSTSSCNSSSSSSSSNNNDDNDYDGSGCDGQRNQIIDNNIRMESDDMVMINQNVNENNQQKSNIEQLVEICNGNQSPLSSSSSYSSVSAAVQLSPINSITAQQQQQQQHQQSPAQRNIGDFNP